MRVAVNEGDPGFDEYVSAVSAGKSIHIFLDGAEVKECLMADEDDGTVVTLKRDGAGNIVFDWDREEVAFEEVRGAVRIELRDAS